MVKIREGLPLVDGQTTQADSATLAAQLVASQRSHQSANSYAQIPLDIKYQLATHKLHTTFDRSAAHTYHLHDPHTEDEYLDDTNALSNKELEAVDLDQANIDVPTWLDNVAKRIGQESVPNLSAACEFIRSHMNTSESERSGAYVTGIGMTDILTYLYQDEEALVAAMLYRSARKSIISLAEVEKNFGPDILTLVKDTLAMGKLSEIIESNKRLEDHFVNNQRDQLSNIYSMLISVTNDVRVVLIKLAERTFAMRELTFSRPERQTRVAREVMTIYAPLAHRLGIAQLKWELEDLAFRYLAPDRYKEIAKLLSEKRSERESYIQRVQDKLNESLADASIEGEVSGRVKHIYSIYRKMKLKGLSFDQLYDIRALRVLVNSPSDCYHVLGLVHGLWRYIPEQFDDYITNPKSNGYRSLHTAVIAENKSLEVQIRTHEMHFEAELGMCAHVNYKEGLKNKKDNYLNQRISSLRQLLSINNETRNQPRSAVVAGEEIDDIEFDEEEQLVDFDELERIYIFSRDGDITELPKGATVLDFAYYVHTQVGNRAQAARVNQRYVPLTYQLKTGEQVEIITKASREPNRDWLVASLGYIHTNRARSKLRQWFNKQDRDKNIEIGRQMLSKELERLSVHPNSIDLNDYIQHFHVNTTDDIIVGLVTGDIGLNQLTSHISRQLHLEPEIPPESFVPHVDNRDTGKLDAYKIHIDGLDNIEINLAGCCHPVHGEPIAGYITLSRGVSVHNRGCPEYLRLVERDPERKIEAAWQVQIGRYQPVDIHVEAYDRRGLLRDLTQIIDKENVNIRQVQTLSNDDNIAFLKFHIEVSGLAHLSKLLAKLEQQHGILHARRAVV
ncbi:MULTISPECIES: RelA/SpoT family protein [unclassified Psychrobacter]|uniref:RelA/SpoT family protein n=1 Tax=unclassified Psychrobacter TaxID=196806 RepID=UPI0008695628|nr:MULTISPECIES: bifunctional (p)ppGpp synthetase/guanosine-3',5'-bis(diphosphate) 3'-pyrophosphohydrolase [unclassified Psychrobacter]MBA6243364.1 bifunctional (p)ppGpp synthetase/guanosine-3',5'-bis(diphosphate) 3'-pyrophosphohydrolase [Psychrobacter sp. Urea-trap-18]MBA6286967.1 bifunctional (p)ppGpp synthetase/guanosine-3',5'-bis(diphosphate) 3'-pyrophosphohydrolase [Psychrobacter sp. Urea-trap-16]MBA6318016.1 bifunctional (p)ppGpp synthetase/guanosine-3',5'-bis(diphosphate) 3'-pyrophosphohy|tara:strand:- start:101208 stop:103745 length:2538 start_codon:yes stop_codon:yes gene_type:complete